MIFRNILVLSFLFSTSTAFFFPHPYPRVKLHATYSREAGLPLYLTPYLKEGDIKGAQAKAKVDLTCISLGNVESYAGLLTINASCDSNLFFWYFPAFSKCAGAPVILWLQGGPGGSSLFGLFVELGPIEVTKDQVLLRKHNWAEEYNLIFIDNPVGTGFSYTKSKDAYCTNEQCVGKGLYEAMTQFFTMFPDLQKNDFYITGESYAGKYIPSLGYIIHKQNECPDTKIKIKLAGMAIGNGFCDPVNQLNYADYLYQIGLIDYYQKIFFLGYQQSIIKAIQKENWRRADHLLDRLMDGEIGNFSYFKSFTGYTNYYNYLYPSDDTTDELLYIELLKSNKMRKMIHVGGLPLNSGKEVEAHLSDDMLKSVAPYIADLLPTYRIMVYNGQLDIIVAYPLSDNFIRKLDYQFTLEENSCRKIWKVGDEIAGYYRVLGNLTQVLVRDAGHMVPKDQPEWALDLITRFIGKKLT